MQRRGSTGVDEEDLFVLVEKAFSHQIDQAGNGFAGVHRIHQNRFSLSKHPHRFDHAVGGQRIAGAHVVIEAYHRLFGKGAFDANFGGYFLYQFIDQLFLCLLGATDIDSDHRDLAVIAVQSGQQPCMGAGAAAGAYNPVDWDSLINSLPENLFCTGDIPEGTDFVGGSTRDDVRTPATTVMDATPMR